ncbi:MAG: protein-S-isoprenylcysteine O-methyltransferase [Beijerinckiaceae bacterium]
MTPTIAKIAYVILAVGWYVLRIPHERRARRTPVASSAKDWRDVLRLLISLTGLGIIPFIYVAIGWPKFADYPFRPLQAWLGVGVAVAALCMFWTTHRALGRNWSVSLELRQGHRLVREGPYRRVRHPMYVAFWLFGVAQALLLPNLIAGLSGILGFGTLYFLRVDAEESLMLQQFGDEYREYMKVTGRLLPKLHAKP